MTEQLKPCPNPECGATEWFIYEDFEGMDFIHCTHCGMCGPEAEETFCGTVGQRHAARLWNAIPRRSDAEALLKALEFLEAKLRFGPISLSSTTVWADCALGTITTYHKNTQTK